jgi:ribosomal protein L16 Arg81 hydroxylase
MSFGATITLNDGQGTPVAVVFNLQQFVPNGADYIDATSTAALTRRLLIRHSNAGASLIKGQKPIRRHLVQAITEMFNEDLGKTEKITANFTFTVDPAHTFTDQQIEDPGVFLSNFIIGSNNMARLLRDES